LSQRQELRRGDFLFMWVRRRANLSELLTKESESDDKSRLSVSMATKQSLLRALPTNTSKKSLTSANENQEVVTKY
jgi:hypothetical protein